MATEAQQRWNLNSPHLSTATRSKPRSFSDIELVTLHLALGDAVEVEPSDIAGCYPSKDDLHRLRRLRVRIGAMLGLDSFSARPAG